VAGHNGALVRRVSSLGGNSLVVRRIHELRWFMQRVSVVLFTSRFFFEADCQASPLLACRSTCNLEFPDNVVDELFLPAD